MRNELVNLIVTDVGYLNRLPNQLVVVYVCAAFIYSGTSLSGRTNIIRDSDNEMITSFFVKSSISMY